MAKKPKPTRRAPDKATELLPGSTTLLADLRELIEASRSAVAQAVNSALVLLYWQVGSRIRADVLRDKRAAYGEQILPTLSAKLAPEYGQGFNERNLARMIRFAEVFPDREIVLGLSRQLGWSHFVEIIPLKTDLHRDFYAEMCRIERWNVRTLRDKIGGMLFERTALSRKPEELARSWQLREADQLSPDLVFRDPYFPDKEKRTDTNFPDTNFPTGSEPEVPLADDPRRVARPPQHCGKGLAPGSMMRAASPGRTLVPFRRHASSPVSRA